MVEIKPHPHTDNPHRVYKEYKRAGRVFRAQSKMSVTTPVHADKIRVVCLADTHDKMDRILHKIPPGDILIHAGDFTDYGDIEKVIKFNRELAQLPHKHKLIVAGNHELGFEKMDKEDRDKLRAVMIHSKSQLLSAGKYLQDSGIKLYGYNFYGSPWHPMPYYDFHANRGQALLDKWNLIPTDTDILITHTPPLGHGDMAHWDVAKGMLAGCVELLNTVEHRVQPKYHIFGHIHPQHGQSTNGVTTFINAAIVNSNTIPTHRCVIFDLPLIEGTTK